MEKRSADADHRRFFDEFVSVKASRLKAEGKLEGQQALIAFPDGVDRIIGIRHTKFPNGGSWSYFICPRCGGRKSKLWLINDAPRCLTCCRSSGVRYRSAYALGQNARLKERDQRVEKIAAMLECGPIRLKPRPYRKAPDRLKRLTITMRRGRIRLRLNQFAHLQSEYRPRAIASDALNEPTKELIELARLTRPLNEIEDALDRAEHILLDALDSSDARRRIQAAAVILRYSRAAIRRGWGA
jgi:hypothetical protein